MRNEIEKRLHRVKIKLDEADVKCPNSKYCSIAENSYRCNEFYEKCSTFLKEFE